MADRGRVKLRQTEIDALIATYRKAYKDVTKEIITASEAGRIQRAKVQATIKLRLRELGEDVDAWSKANIPKYYLDGSNIAIQDLRDLGVDTSKTAGLAIINKRAIEALVSETSDSLFASITGVQRNASNIINQAIRQQTNFVIADGRLKGEALKVITDNIKLTIKEGGLGALTDKAGKRWSYEAYSRMLVRTKAVEARNQGLANRMLQNGYDLVQVTRHNSKHKACARWEGVILSLTGKTPGYPTLNDAISAGLLHPNCQHGINAINKGLAEETKAYDNPYNYLSPEQQKKADIEFKNRNRKKK